MQPPRSEMQPVLWPQKTLLSSGCTRTKCTFNICQYSINCHVHGSCSAVHACASVFVCAVPPPDYPVLVNENECVARALPRVHAVLQNTVIFGHRKGVVIEQWPCYSVLGFSLCQCLRRVDCNHHYLRVECVKTGLLLFN